MSLALVLLAAAVAAPALLAEKRAIETPRARIRATFERDGLTLEGDPLRSYKLTGKTGVPHVSLQNRVLVKQPGQTERDVGARYREGRCRAPGPQGVQDGRCRRRDGPAASSASRAHRRRSILDSKYDSILVSQVPSDMGTDFR